MKQKIIEFKDFSFKYFSQAKETLININLSIKKGEKILILGPSGSGKSTLANCLNGLIPFSYKGDISGSLKISGLETSNLDIFQISKMVGTVLQDPDGQFIGLTVNEDIAFTLENDNVKQDEMKSRVSRASKLVDMSDFGSSSPFELSGGQKQRTSLAGVLIDDVDILLFDEPLANLDPATGKSAIEIIDEIYEDTEKTVIIVEHRLEDVLHRKVDRILLMNEGQIIADEPPHTLLSSRALIDNGIREPLYLTALKYAGIELSQALKPAYLDTLDYESIRESLVKWNDAAKIKIDKSDLNNLLEIKNLKFSYDGISNTIDNMSFSIKKGEILSVIGKNGAGKSTLSRLICGFENEDEGKIFYNGSDLSHLTIKERANKIGMVMQNPNQMISKSKIFEEVSLGLKLRNCDDQYIKDKVRQVLDVCGLLPFQNWPISALSFGQKKRVTIASILVLDPQLIILDEPTAGQDFRHYRKIMKFIEEINRKGVAILFITHDMHLMLEHSDRAIVISEGKIIADKRPSDVLSNEKIIEQASLRETSLYTLSKKVGISDGSAFVQNFINFERQIENHER